MLLASALRPAGVLTVRSHPNLIPCAASLAWCTASTRPTHTGPSCFSKNGFPILKNRTVRHASASSQQSPSKPTSQQTSPGDTSKTLTWNRFLALRRTRRKISVAASSISSLVTAYTGLRIFIQAGYDTALSASLGLDPILTTGLSTIAFLGAGWLIGPFFGEAVFNMRYSSIRSEIMNKEREFYNRIKRHRVDPTASSIANPVPDYYGEKIGSVADYRRWLKDQRAFNLKRGAYQGSKNNGLNRTALVLGIWGRKK